MALGAEFLGGVSRFLGTPLDSICDGHYASRGTWVRIDVFDALQCPHRAAEALRLRIGQFFWLDLAAFFWIIFIGAVHLFHRQWKQGFVVLLSLVGAVLIVILYLILNFFLSFVLPSEDYFAARLSLPPGVELAESLASEDSAFPPKIKESDESDSSIEEPLSKPKPNEDTRLILRNGLQPGIYIAQYQFNPGEPGTVYLKAYEITNNFRLSKYELKKRSQAFLNGSQEPETICDARSSEFTIYEGDWGDDYAARFEVWFQPQQGGHERKILEKNYKIQGWMR